MKSFTVLIKHILELTKGRSLAILIAVTLPVLSPLAFAADDIWSLDSATSSARFFQGSRANPDSLNTGVARVTGHVKLDPHDLDNSVFDLSMYPADEQWGEALTSEGALPAGYVPDSTDHTLLTFQSKRILRIGDDKLEVIGNLTVTRAERTITVTPNNAYSGPVYGDAVLHAETRQISFVFPLSAALSSGHSTPGNLKEKRELNLSGPARIGYETFPGLLSAIQATNWPPVVQNERCQMPSTIGEDYHGSTCTGTVIATTRHDNCEMPSTVGEDYSGPTCTPASGDQTTIVLDLKLHQSSVNNTAANLLVTPEK